MPCIFVAYLGEELLLLLLLILIFRNDFKSSGLFLCFPPSELKFQFCFNLSCMEFWETISASPESYGGGVLSLTVW